jgi:outer membrane lipoprotein-sorting protein
MSRVSAREEVMSRVSAREEVMSRASSSRSSGAHERPSGASRVTARVVLGLLVFGAACASPRVTLPSGTGTPFPDFVSAYTQATAECRAVKTMSASLSLSGRAGSTKLSARIDAGFAEPARLRLEGYPRVNFGGKPFFVLVANGPTATLVLTRDDRVLRSASSSAIIEALAGVALEPDELRALVSGCALGAGQPAAGRAFENGWAAIDSGDSTPFLRQLEGQWRIVAARRGSLTVEYSNFAGGRPSTIRVHTTSAPGVAPADLTLRITQVEVNTPLDNAVFDADVPPNAAPLTLDELRRAGPLGGE